MHYIVLDFICEKLVQHENATERGKQYFDDVSECLKIETISMKHLFCMYVSLLMCVRAYNLKAFVGILS